MTTINKAIKMLKELEERYGEETDIVLMSDAEGNEWSKMVSQYGVGYIWCVDDELYNQSDIDDMIDSGEAFIEEFDQVITLWRQ